MGTSVLWKTCTAVFIAALVKMVPKIKIAQISTSNRMDKQMKVHTKEYCMAMEIKKPAATSNNMYKSYRYTVVLSKRSQTQNSTCCDFFI